MEKLWGGKKFVEEEFKGNYYGTRVCAYNLLLGAEYFYNVLEILEPLCHRALPNYNYVNFQFFETGAICYANLFRTEDELKWSNLKY